MLSTQSASMDAGEPFDPICLDIRMPEMNGHEALRTIRELEKSHDVVAPNGTRIVMTTALDGARGVFQSLNELCDAYLLKPIDKSRLLEQLHGFGLIG